MSRSVFDLDSGEFIYTSGDTGYDSDGHFHMRMGDSLSLDMDSGELHLTSSWEDDRQRNSFCEDNDW